MGLRKRPFFVRRDGGKERHEGEKRRVSVSSCRPRGRLSPFCGRGQVGWHGMGLGGALEVLGSRNF